MDEDRLLDSVVRSGPTVPKLGFPPHSALNTVCFPGAELHSLFWSRENSRLECVGLQIPQRGVEVRSATTRQPRKC